MIFCRIFKLGLVLALLTPFSAQAAEKMVADRMVPKKTLMVFGDSLVAGYGLPLDQAFPAQLERKLKEEGHDVRVLNAGVSGDTTAGGLARLEWSLQDDPGFVILVLGGNDMLRAINPDVTRKNLKGMLEILKARKIPVLLSGMRSYRNLGEIFGGSYQRMYEDLAEEYDAVFYPFFLEDVALDATLNLEDGMHPNARGIAVIVDNIYDAVEELLEKGGD